MADYSMFTFVIHLFTKSISACNLKGTNHKHHCKPLAYKTVEVSGRKWEPYTGKALYTVNTKSWVVKFQI